MRLALLAAAVAAVGACAAAAAVRAPVPARVCSDRGEANAPISPFSTPRDVVAGRVAFRGLKDYAKRSLLGPPVGTGTNRVYFAKAGAVVRTGTPVTISIVPADRRFASLAYVRGPGLGLRMGYPAERLEPCPPATKAFAYKGKVGPLTSFPGGFVVKRPACVRIVVTSANQKPIRRAVSIGKGTCRA